MYQLTQKYKVANTSFKSLNKDLQLEIDLNGNTSNDLLQLLMQKGMVTHFEENVPTINDIFIQSVS